MPGFNNFILGNAKQIMTYGELNKKAKENNLEPMPARFEWLYENTLTAEEFKKYPNTIVNMNGQINLCISDPAVV